MWLCSKVLALSMSGPEKSNFCLIRTRIILSLQLEALVCGSNGLFLSFQRKFRCANLTSWPRWLYSLYDAVSTNLARGVAWVGCGPGRRLLGSVGLMPFALLEVE